MLMLKWEEILNAISEITATAIESSTSGFISLTKIGLTLIGKGVLKDYDSGQPTEKQLKHILSEIKKQGGSCEIIMKGKEILIKVDFQDQSIKG